MFPDLQRIESYLEPFCKYADEGQPFCWDSLIQYIQFFDLETYNPQEDWDPYRYFFTLMERYKCNNVEVMANILYKFHLFRKYYYLMGFLMGFIANIPQCISHILKGRCVTHSSSDSCKDPGKLVYRVRVPHMQQLMTFEYRNLKSICFFNPVRQALLTSDEYALEIFVKYGVSYQPPLDDSCQREIAFLYLQAIGKPELWEVANHQELEVRICKYYGREERRRLMMVLQGLEVLLLNRYRVDPAKCVRHFQIIFQTIPEPYITSLEIQKFLRCVSRHHNSIISEEAESLVQKISCKYEETFPESVEPKQPRSLLHLCRCQVRQNLRKAGTIHYGGTQLGLPPVLEKYILLQKNDSLDPHLR